uniref:NADH dehydrogenase subunit 5 n=1 Tax=Euglandina singleyana TaxID=169637 RepID=UPI002551E284|nr:NADH dehydrogenase subunit 5 [Euglandina singleyana]WFQ82717.1 NADH dehydrogenase subunit 5 [Euglandina singleyana]
MNFNSLRLSVLLWFMSLTYIVSFLTYTYYNAQPLVVELSVGSFSSVNISFSIFLDMTSLSFSFVVTFISACVFWFATYYMREDVFFFRFIWLLFSFVLSMNMLIFSGSMLTLLLGWDGLGISSFALIIYYMSKESLEAGFLTLLVNRLGDVMIMSTMVVLMVLGTTTFVSTMAGFYMVVFIFSLAALTKSAQYPFSAWLPAAMAAPTPVSALVHSSTLVTAGIYLIIRVSLSVPLDVNCSSIMLFCGSTTTLLGGVCALYENDIKKVIALSTLSQLGVMVFSLGLNLPYLALLHLYTHAMFKALLFLCAGVILMVSFGVQDLRLLGGVLKYYPLVVVFMNTSTLCLMGAPFLSAYYSKHLILESMLMSNINSVSVLLMTIGTILTCVYMVRTMYILTWGVNLNSVKSKSMLKYNLSMIPLYLLSIMLGKVMSSLVHENYSVVMIPVNFYHMMNLIFFLGVMWGLYQWKSCGFKTLTEMFWIAPTSKGMVNPMFKISKMMTSLDYGWIEPSCFLNSFMFKQSYTMYMLVQWPYNTFSFLSVLSLCFSLLGWFYFF